MRLLGLLTFASEQALEELRRGPDRDLDVRRVSLKILLHAVAAAAAASAEASAAAAVATLLLLPRLLLKREILHVSVCVRVFVFVCGARDCLSACVKRRRDLLTERSLSIVDRELG